jgi:hypothetical protein
VLVRSVNIDIVAGGSIAVEGVWRDDWGENGLADSLMASEVAGVVGMKTVFRTSRRPRTVPCLRVGAEIWACWRR